jgi:hypothetical protein
MPSGHRAGAGTEPARRTAVAIRGPEGISDEDAAWIDGLAQRLDVANQLARRVAGTTDPELAAEAVRGGASRTTSTGFSWIPAYGQKIDPRSNSLFGRENSLFGKNNSLFRRKNSLFHLLGNFAASI